MALVWANPSGTIIFIEAEYQKSKNERGDVYLIREGSRDVQIVKRNGRDRLYFDDAGKVIGWTQTDTGADVHLADNSVLPIVGSKRSSVGMDGDGRFFFTDDLETLQQRHGYVADSAAPYKILFEFEDIPYQIWHQGNTISLACVGKSGNHETRLLRYSLHSGVFQLSLDIQIPGSVWLIDPWSDAVILDREGVSSFMHKYFLFDLGTREQTKLPGDVPMNLIPVFLRIDWIHKSSVPANALSK